ncbi:hypothetical protein GPJ56_006650 [Histomonas meleagridis]|uniref:uncharacterized protein n=1 Tax=Histomonas meleagridis TaxID=135588 RepID=UPI00355A236C|nr:hypothetical protein GPJ56_006650 [Histomonas meleagridis]KAH0803661.1 hypothetical protein GO595_003545 [Histomonas meleagridis]
METFGELVTHIKRGLLDLYEDLLDPGSAQALGPVHAYGKSFLIYQSFKTLQEAIINQERFLKTHATKDGAYGAVQNNDTKLWRVVDSIFQSLSLIDRYAQDPSKSTHQGIAEWFKQEAKNCGLTSTYIDNGDQEGQLIISGKGFSFDIKIEGQEYISSANLHVNASNTDFDLPEIKEFLETGRQSHVSHLMSMAARLYIIEHETQQQQLSSVISSLPTALTFKLSLGGYRFPFIDGYDAVLTFDTFEQQRKTPMIVIDPPIIFPTSQLKEVSNLCGHRLVIENSLSSTPSKIMKLKTDVIRSIGDNQVRLLLNDKSVYSIVLARVPLTRLESFDTILNILKRAATWGHVIHDAFCEQEEQTTGSLSIDIAPNDNFTLAITYWIQDCPARLVVEVLPDGTLTTSDEAQNEALGCPTTSFPSIISRLIS